MSVKKQSRSLGGGNEVWLLRASFPLCHMIVANSQIPTGLDGRSLSMSHQGRPKKSRSEAPEYEG